MVFIHTHIYIYIYISICIHICTRANGDLQFLKGETRAGTEVRVPTQAVHYALHRDPLPSWAPLRLPAPHEAPLGTLKESLFTQRLQVYTFSTFFEVGLKSLNVAPMVSVV